MEFTVPFDPFELYLVSKTQPGNHWVNKQQLFSEVRHIIRAHLGPEKSYFQEGIKIHITFYMNPSACWLSRRQANQIRTLPFSLLLKLAEYILEKTLYESNYYVRDIVAEKRYDNCPRIEMRYDLHGKKNFK